VSFVTLSKHAAAVVPQSRLLQFPVVATLDECAMERESDVFQPMDSKPYSDLPPRSELIASIGNMLDPLLELHNVSPYYVGTLHLRFKIVPHALVESCYRSDILKYRPPAQEAYRIDIDAA